MSNLLGIGTKVKFLTTPDSGVIIEKLGDGMVMVQLDNVDMDIPAFEEDLVRAENFIQYIESYHVTYNKNKLSKKQQPNISANPFENKPSHLPPVDPLSIKPVLGNTGVHIGFLPFKKKDGEIEKFDIFILNDTLFDGVFDCEFSISDTVKWSKNNFLKAASFEKIGEMPFDTLNDTPSVKLTFEPIFTAGFGEKLHKSLKIKAQQFMKKYTLFNFIKTDIYLFTLFEKLDKTEAAPEQLKNYTEQLTKNNNILKQKHDKNTLTKLYDPTPNTSEFAAFVPEIDLHIETLHTNARTLSNGDIIRIQMRSFDHFLEKAIRLGVPKVYAIHGLGKGKLRDMIAAKLKRHPEILSFKNEYHEKYGWGATEICLM